MSEKPKGQPEFIPHRTPNAPLETVAYHARRSAINHLATMVYAKEAGLVVPSEDRIAKVVIRGILEGEELYEAAELYGHNTTYGEYLDILSKLKK